MKYVLLVLGMIPAMAAALLNGGRVVTQSELHVEAPGFESVLQK